jgi:membrane associated rhomboid family serine protease
VERAKNILWGSDRNALVYLIGINAILFIIIRMLFIIFQNDQETVYSEYERVVSQFALPAHAGDFIRKPWTLISWFFTHVSFLQFLSNLIWLFSFAYLLQVVAGNRYLFPAYFYGGLISGVVFLLMYNLLPQFLNGNEKIPSLLGAHPAILAVSVMAVSFAPDFRIFPFIKGGIPVWILLALFVLVDLISLWFNNRPLIAVHLAGAATGWGYATLVKRGSDPGAWMGNLYETLSGRGRVKQPPPREKVFYKAEKEPFTKQKKVTQSTVDEVLDKINRTGYHSLTREEKEILKKAKDDL